MNFDEQYLKYDDYQALGGFQIEQTPFNLLEFEARRKIDEKTFNRIKGTAYEDIPQEVKLCVYKLINSIVNVDGSTNNVASNGNVKSENTDGYSISYVTAAEISDIVKSKNDEMNDIIRTYLLGIIFNDEHLLYVGVD